MVRVVEGRRSLKSSGSTADQFSPLGSNFRTAPAISVDYLADTISAKHFKYSMVVCAESNRSKFISEHLGRTYPPFFSDRTRTAETMLGAPVVSFARQDILQSITK